MLKVAIVEDETAEAERLANFLQRYEREQGEKLLVQRFPDGLDFVENYKADFDIIFMDISMPLMDGMEAAKRIRKTDQNVCLIFVTNMMQYALSGYEVDARDFLVKPVEYLYFSKRLQKAVEYCKRSKGNDIVLSGKGGFVRLNSRDILYVEVIAHTLVYHCVQGVYEVRGTMKEAEEAFRGREDFARCSNSYLVNLNYVKALHGSTVQVEGDQIQIGKTKRKEFLDKLNRFLGEEQ